MLKRIFLLLIILGTYNVLLAQGISKSIEDSLAHAKAEALFYEAYSNENQWTNQQRIELLEQSDSIFRTVEDWKFSIAAINALCNLGQMERAYEKINKYSKDALDIAEEHLAVDDPYYGAVLNLRGTILWSYKGDYGNAINLLKEAIIINKKNNIPAQSTAYIYYNLGDCYQDAGDYDQAIDQLENALKTQLDSTNTAPDLTTNIYNQIGLCYTDKKQYSIAVENFEKGINYAKSIPSESREVNQIILYLYQNIADLYLRMNRPKEAKKYIDLALDFQKGQAFINDGYTLQLQGEMLLQQGNYARAISAFSQSIQLVEKEYQDFKYHLQIGLAYQEKAAAFLKINQPDSVIHYCQLALKHNTNNIENAQSASFNIIDHMNSPLHAIEVFETRALAYRQKSVHDKTNSSLQKAFENFELAASAITKTRQSFIAEGSKHTLAEKVNRVYESAINTTYELFTKTKDSKWLIEAIQFAENNKSSSLFESIQEREAIGQGSIPDSLLKLEYDLKVDIAYYEKLIYEANQQKTEPVIALIKNYEHTLFNKKESYQKLIDQFEVDFPDYFELKYKTIPLDLAKVQSDLEDQMLVEYFVGNDYVFAFSITRDQIYCERIIRTLELEKDIDAIRGIIVNPPETKNVTEELQSFKKLSNRLYQQLLQPILSKHKSEVNRILIIPDDLMAYLPFSVLLTSEVKTAEKGYKVLPYLFKKYHLSYHYSIAFLSGLKEERLEKMDHEFIGFAPSFNTTDSLPILGPLSCNNIEVDKIGTLLNSDAIYTNEAATLQDFKEKSRQSRIIHLATHAVLENQNSAFNRIYFSDDYLSLNELSSLDLQADLVVLSACNSGAGILRKGEGVMSLSKGFFQAGCPSVLTSLWSVDDCTTADIMLQFYEEIHDGKYKDVALSEAKKQYLEQTSDLLQAHPYYWAAFVQYGDVKALKRKTKNNFYLYLVGLFLLIGFTFFFRKK